MKIKLLIMFLIVSAIANSADLSFEGYAGTLRIAGGTAHIPAMKEIARKISKKNPNIKIAIAGGGSGVGIKKVGEGLVDIGNAGRKATVDEIRKYNLVPKMWAVDAIAVIVHPSNKIKALSRSDIAAIFAGKIKNWKELGGADAAIDIYTRDKASGTRKVFWKKILQKGPISEKADFVPSNGAMKRVVSGDPDAIGFMSAGFVDKSVKALAIDGVKPTVENVISGRYPYKRGLYSITKGVPSGLKKVFMDYLLSDDVQHEIVPSKGFIPVR